MQIQRISPRQLAWLLTTYIVTASLLSLPQLLTRLVGGDAWAFEIFPIIYGLLVCGLFYMLTRRFPGKNLFDINFLLAGKLLGTVLNLVLVLNIWFILVRDIRYFIFFLKTTLLPRTPEEILTLLFMLVLIYYGRLGIEVTARVNELLLPLLLLVLLFVPLLLANEISISTLEPFFDAKPVHMAATFFAASSFYGDFIVAGVFLHMVSNHLQLKTAIRHGIIQSSVVLMYVMLTSIAVFGSRLVAIQNYPHYQAFAQIHITDFLDRVELFEFALYFPAFVLNASLSFLALLIGAASFTKQKDYRVYSKAVGWVIVATVYLAFRNTAEGYRFSLYGYPTFVMLVHPVYYVLLLVLGLIKGKRHAAAGTVRAGDNRQEDPLQEEADSKQDEAGALSDAPEVSERREPHTGERGSGQTIYSSPNNSEDEPMTASEQADSSREQGGDADAGASEGGTNTAAYSDAASNNEPKSVNAGAPNGDKPSRTMKQPVRVYARRTFVLIVTALLFLLAGYLFSYRYQWVSRICATGFFLSMIAMYITSRQEMMAAESE